MRVLHTADWHLGDRLGRIDRTDDLRRAVERVAGYCEGERVDVLLVAGDLFSDLSRADGLRESIAHLQAVFLPFLRNRGTIVALTGNHDNETFCQTLQHALTLAAPANGETGDLRSGGRLFLATGPSMLTLAGREEEPVQFVLMPFPTASRYLDDQAPRTTAWRSGTAPCRRPIPPGSKRSERTRASGTTCRRSSRHTSTSRAPSFPTCSGSPSAKAWSSLKATS